jgi:hypothetical protein
MPAWAAHWHKANGDAAQTAALLRFHSEELETALTLDLQRISIKIHSEAAANISLDPYLEIFGRWRADKTHPAEWIDLADYAHVPKGPGIVLIGLKAMFSFDMADPAPGLAYVSRRGLSGSPEQRIRQVLRAGFDLASRITAEKNYPAAARLRTDSLELRFPDRLTTPNTPATDAALGPAIQAALDTVFGSGAYQLTPVADGGCAFGYDVRAAKAEPLAALLSRAG